jgi:hypothetical protein
MTTKIVKLLFCSGILLISCQKNSKYEIKITQQNSGFGYQILKKHKILISQPFIPAIQGEKTFKNETDAQKTADLVVSKIDKYSLPKISVHELDSMKIAY